MTSGSPEAYPPRDLQAFEKEEAITSGDALKLYHVICEEFGRDPRGYTTFWKHMKSLEISGMIESRTDSLRKAGENTTYYHGEYGSGVLEARLSGILSVEEVAHAPNRSYRGRVSQRLFSVCAMAGDQTFKAVLNDTNPKAKGRSFSIDISGTGYNHFLGKSIGDTVDGMFVGEGDKTLRVHIGNYRRL